MSLRPSLNQLIVRFHEQVPTQASSLINPLYGDAIEPYGGIVWLGSQIKLLEPIGINERLIRTSIFRLTKEGWLTAEKVGRRSDYGLTTTGRRRFDQLSNGFTAPRCQIGKVHGVLLSCPSSLQVNVKTLGKLWLGKASAL